jgi:hypothetical protein
MKKNSNSRTIRALTLAFLLALSFGCEEAVIKTSSKPLAATAIAEALNAFIGNGSASLTHVNSYFFKQYNLDFESEFQKLRPYFISGNNNYPSAKVQEITLYNLQNILNDNGIHYGSASYNYLAALSDIFNDGLYEEDGVEELIYEMRNEIAQDYTMDDSERNNLLATWDALLVNHDGLVQVTQAVFNGEIYAMARTQGWLRNAWRIFRSVVLLAAVGALIGATFGLTGVIVGAVVMGIVAITDAWANGYCHYALQCDGGWRQSCSTGECMPYYDDNP